MTAAAYRLAFLVWLACAHAGRPKRAAQAVRAVGSDLATDVAFAATGGHVLDFDDTLSDGVAHVSAATAPAARLREAEHGAGPLDVVVHPVAGPRGAPGRPVTAAELAAKVSDLTGDRLNGALGDIGAPAVTVLRAAGLSS